MMVPTSERKVDGTVKKTLLIADMDGAFWQIMEKLLAKDFHVLCTDSRAVEHSIRNAISCLAEMLKMSGARRVG